MLLQWLNLPKLINFSGRVLVFSCRLSSCILIIPIISSCAALEEAHKKAELERLNSVKTAEAKKTRSAIEDAAKNK
jgi:hypothetical protein